MLSVGCAPDASPDDVARSRRVIQDGPKEILGKDFDERLIATSALDDYHNIPAVRSAHLLQCSFHQTS